MKKNIIALIPSQNSVEDASWSRFVLEKYKPDSVTVITSDYHIKRAELVLKTVFAPYTYVTVCGINSDHINGSIITE